MFHIIHCVYIFTANVGQFEGKINSNKNKAYISKNNALFLFEVGSYIL